MYKTMKTCFMCYIIPNLNPFILFVAVIFTIICFQIIILFVQCVKYLKSPAFKIATFGVSFPLLNRSVNVITA